MDDFTRTSDERYSFIVCVNLCAHFLHVQKCERFPSVNVTVRRGLSLSHINDTQSTHTSIKNNNLSLDCEKRRKLIANAQRVFNANGLDANSAH